jgi:sporulation protein YlmC with PRC-barrel domain
MERRSLAPLLLAAALAPGLARAQGAAPPGLAPGQIRAKDLMDRDIYSSDGVEIGEVEDLVIDPASGRIVSVVVEVESRLGFTDKFVTLPLDRLRVGMDRRITAGLTREEFRAAPGIRYRD